MVLSAEHRYFGNAYGWFQWYFGYWLEDQKTMKEKLGDGGKL